MSAVTGASAAAAGGGGGALPSAAIEAWTRARPIDDVIAALEAANVPVGRIYTVADIARDPQYLARDMIVQTHDVDGRPLKVPGIVPRLADTPGRLRTPAPRLGQHTDEVLGASGWPARREAANDGSAS